MQLRYENKQLPWWEWSPEQANYNKKFLIKYKEDNKELLLEHYLLQWHLFRQWNLVRESAKELGILLFGDLPFYVSRDSSDVLSNQELEATNDSEEYEVEALPPLEEENLLSRDIEETIDSATDNSDNKKS